LIDCFPSNHRRPGDAGNPFHDEPTERAINPNHRFNRTDQRPFKAHSTPELSPIPMFGLSKAFPDGPTEYHYRSCLQASLSTKCGIEPVDDLSGSSNRFDPNNLQHQKKTEEWRTSTTS